MKHFKVLSNEMPAKAEETAWVTVKDIFVPGNLTGSQAEWVAAQVDHKLQK